MRWGRIAGLGMVIVVALGVAGGMIIRRRSNPSPATLTGPNLLQNSTFALDADGDGMPDGWTAQDRGGVRLSDFRFAKGAPGKSISIDGINNYLASPFIAVRPGMTYRVAFRALADNPDKPSPTRARIRFHWRDDEGVEFSNIAGTWQDVPYRTWATISSSAIAPAGATQLSISIHPGSDDRIIVDQLGLGQVGVRIAPWPNGKAAALSLSFDYETAMGGLVHSRSDDPANSVNPLIRAQRMRVGADEISALFSAAQLRGTWYTTGYNFLKGNQDHRQFMDNPTYSSWATVANGWPTNYWAQKPWFSLDPYQDEQTAPEWYFGSQVAKLRAGGQDIQSHTFAHFAGGLVTPADWRADFAAWDAVAGAAGVAKPTSLAFPWSWSGGMEWDSWEVLKANGITSVTRTNTRQPRFRIADRDTYALRRLPGHDTITAIADEYLTPNSLPRVKQRLEVAQLNEGAIDIWAHTEEVTSPEQRAAWEAIIAARDPFWVASVPDIVAWNRTLDQVGVTIESEQPAYRFTITNRSGEMLHGLTLVLPFTPRRIAVDGKQAGVTGDRLELDVRGHTTVEVTLWHA